MMPAQRLYSAQPAAVHPYDVLAQSDGTSDLMLHALLCNEAASQNGITDSSVLRTFHMGPPLGPRRDLCDAVGSANLSADQRRKIKSFVDDRRAEKEAEKRRLRARGLSWNATAQYRIQPAATRPSRRFPLWRFSCVGLVLEAYKTARVYLLAPPLPLKTVADLKRLYPQFASELDDPDTRHDLGIGTGDRWPVALVGYVVHSLARTAAEINGAGAQPYQPHVGDEFYPRQNGEAEGTG